MRDGLYCVQFQTPLGTGGGVIVLHGGKISGGDSSMFYTGTYKETGNQFEATVSTDRHTPGLPSSLGRDKNTLTLKGTTQGDSAQMAGTAKEAPGVNLRATLRRLAD